MGDRIVLLREGLVVQTGTPRELYTRPATAFAAAFFSEVNTLRGTVRDGGVRTVLGRVDLPGLPDGAGVSLISAWTRCGFQRTRTPLLPMPCGPGSRDAICCPAPCCSIFRCRMKGKAGRPCASRPEFPALPIFPKAWTCMWKCPRGSCTFSRMKPEPASKHGYDALSPG